MVLVVATLQARASSELAAARSVHCDVLELRLDAPIGRALPRSLGELGRPVLASCRRAEDGGLERLDESERERVLSRAVAAGAALVDIEHDAPFRAGLARMAQAGGTAIVVSHHDLVATPDVNECLGLLASMREGADVVKLATRITGPADVETLLEVALRAPALGVPFTVMGVGDATLRALSGPLGMALVYAAPGRPEVAGQLPAELQSRLPRTPAPSGPGRAYVLLGRPVAHSLSPRMHSAAFSHLGEAATYRAIDVRPERLEATLASLAEAGVVGGNVTSPHKDAVWRLCDHLTPEAEAAGAVNTFRFEDGSTHGHTTDGLGLVAALEGAGQRVRGRAALVAGAGGTARAVAVALAGEGVLVTLTNRTAGKVDAFARTRGLGSVPFSAGAWQGVLASGDLLVNATPADLPLDAATLAGLTTFDASYGPDRSALAGRARRAGGRAFDGVDLLVHQGALSLEYWLGHKLGPDVVPVMSCAARTGALEQRYGRART